MNATTEQEQLSIDGVAAADPNEAPHMIARVNAMAIKVAFPFMAQNDIRYYLNGINVRPLEDGAVMIVATDGHRYVVIRDQHGYAEKEVILSIKKDGLKTCNAKSTLDVMSNGSAMVNDENGQAQFIQPGNSLIEGNFPRIENVASAIGYSEGISGAINPAYLKDALAIGQHFGAILFFTKDADSALVFVVSGLGDLEVFGGIMKMREVFDQLPTWFPRPVPYELTQPVGDV
ncbi:UNVERIFIED_ORG: DNA polymerase III sliding clamp (beta) subunit (PCNA family) [Burkholderia sp. 1263]